MSASKDAITLAATKRIMAEGHDYAPKDAQKALDGWKARQPATKLAPTKVFVVAPSSPIGHPNGVVVSSSDIQARNRLRYGVQVTMDDIESIRDYLRYSVESIQAVIALEERCGNRAPILQTLRAYAAEASSLLARLA